MNTPRAVRDIARRVAVSLSTGTMLGKLALSVAAGGLVLGSVTLGAAAFAGGASAQFGAPRSGAVQADAVPEGVAVVGAPPAVLASPKPSAKPSPSAKVIQKELTISGPGLATTITIRSDLQPTLYTSLFSQVSFMSSATPNSTTAPKNAGPAYVITSYVKGVRADAYDVYPQCQGGPEASREADNGDGKLWYFVPYTITSVLESAGVNLQAIQASSSAGTSPTQALGANNNENIAGLIEHSRLLLGLGGLAALAVLITLAAAARLSRRLERRRTAPAAVTRLETMTAAARPNAANQQPGRRFGRRAPIPAAGMPGAGRPAAGMPPAARTPAGRAAGAGIPPGGRTVQSGRGSAPVVRPTTPQGIPTVRTPGAPATRPATNPVVASGSARVPGTGGTAAGRSSVPGSSVPPGVAASSSPPVTSRSFPSQPGSVPPASAWPSSAQHASVPPSAVPTGAVGWSPVPAGAVGSSSVPPSGTAPTSVPLGAVSPSSAPASAVGSSPVPSSAIPPTPAPGSPAPTSTAVGSSSDPTNAIPTNAIPPTAVPTGVVDPSAAPSTAVGSSPVPPGGTAPPSRPLRSAESWNENVAIGTVSFQDPEGSARGVGSASDKSDKKPAVGGGSGVRGYGALASSGAAPFPIGLPSGDVEPPAAHGGNAGLLPETPTVGAPRQDAVRPDATPDTATDMPLRSVPDISATQPILDFSNARKADAEQDRQDAAARKAKRQFPIQSRRAAAPPSRSTTSDTTAKSGGAPEADASDMSATRSDKAEGSEPIERILATEAPEKIVTAAPAEVIEIAATSDPISKNPATDPDEEVSVERADPTETTVTADQRDATVTGATSDTADNAGTAEPAEITEGDPTDKAAGAEPATTADPDPADKTVGAEPAAADLDPTDKTVAPEPAATADPDPTGLTDEAVTAEPAATADPDPTDKTVAGDPATVIAPGAVDDPDDTSIPDDTSVASSVDSDGSAATGDPAEATVAAMAADLNQSGDTTPTTEEAVTTDQTSTTDEATNNNEPTAAGSTPDNEMKPDPAATSEAAPRVPAGRTRKKPGAAE